MARPTLQVYMNNPGEVRWRLIAKNGEVQANGTESFANPSNARRAAKAAQRAMAAAIFVDLTKPVKVSKPTARQK